jgi:hypothetical protein
VLVVLSRKLKDKLQREKGTERYCNTQKNDEDKPIHTSTLSSSSPSTSIVPLLLLNNEARPDRRGRKRRDLLADAGEGGNRVRREGELVDGGGIVHRDVGEGSGSREGLVGDERRRVVVRENSRFGLSRDSENVRGGYGFG